MGDKISGNPPQYLINAKVVSQSFITNAVAPHASTQRWTYTVPAGKVFELLNGIVYVRRAGAAAPVGDVTSYIQYTGGSAKFLFVKFNDNTVNFIKDVQLGQGAIFLAGSQIEAYTEDLSTGGTIDYNLAIIGLEYDAP